MHTVSLHDKAFRLKSFLSLTLDLILFFLLTLGNRKTGPYMWLCFETERLRGGGRRPNHQNGRKQKCMPMWAEVSAFPAMSNLPLGPGLPTVNVGCADENEPM